MKDTNERAMHSNKIAIALAAILAASSGATVAACPAGVDAAPREISIPAQSLDRALLALAAQTGIDVLFEPATVAGFNAEAVRGHMSPGEALCQLLEGFELEYTVNADRTIIIRRPRVFTEASASLDTSTNVFQVPAETAQVAPTPATAQNTGDEARPAHTEEVVVTGTRRSDRTIADSPVPIDVIAADSLQNSARPTPTRRCPMLVPSFNFPQPSITGGTDIIKPATLRGLGPDHTLVLVNGKRRHVSALLNINGSVGRGSAAVDMSLLPVTSIQRIEVLRDGAAAQYGSDAIAGVLNVLLKNQREGGSLSVTYGQTYTTVDGAPRATGMLLQPNGQPVLTPDRVFALQYDGNREARDGESVTIAGDIGLPLGSEGFVNVSAQLRDREPTNRAGYDPRQQYPRLPNGQFDPRELTFNRLSHRFGEAKIEDLNVVVNAGTPIAGGAAEWYGFGTYGERDGRTEGFYRLANDARTVPAIFPDGFLAQVLVDLSDYAAASGVRGAAFDWNYDASLNFGRNGFDFITANSNNASLGAASPTRFDAGGLRYQQYSANLDLQREFNRRRARSAIVGGVRLRISQRTFRSPRRRTRLLRPGRCSFAQRRPRRGRRAGVSRISARQRHRARPPQQQLLPGPRSRSQRTLEPDPGRTRRRLFGLRLGPELQARDTL